MGSHLVATHLTLMKYAMLGEPTNKSLLRNLHSGLRPSLRSAELKRSPAKGKMGLWGMS